MIEVNFAMCEIGSSKVKFMGWEISESDEILKFCVN